MADLDLPATIAAIDEDFAILSDWEERYAHLIELGRALPSLPDTDKTEANRVRGCASQVWVTSSREADRLIFHGDSDAHIVKGLVALVLRLYSGRTRKEILDLDAKAVFARWRLDEALSAQRANGLASLVARIRALAEAAT